MTTLRLTTTTPAPGMADGDYTADFVEAGTTLSLAGTVSVEGVPVDRAWVENEILHMEGPVAWGT